MDYAIVLISKKQYLVRPGDELRVAKLEIKKGKTLKFDQVLLVSQKDKLSLGSPYVKGAMVEASLIDQVKDKKIRVAKFRAKSRYRRVTGHRQSKSLIKIDKIKISK